jgi:DNA-binding PadR family transcriptional regulator
MSKENTTLYAILGLLTHEDMSGYDIKKRIDSSINNFWCAGYGQIYPALKVLEKDGFVTKAAGANVKGPERIIYSITESGRKMLIDWLETSSEKEYVKYEILLKLFFGNMLSVQDNIKKIMEFRTRNQEKLKMMELFSENLEKVLADNRDHYYYYLTVLFGKYTYKAYLDWADEAVKILEDMER